MTQAQLLEIFQRHYGASAELARELQIHKTTVSLWFRGHVQSKRIATAIRDRAVELLDRERVTPFITPIGSRRKFRQTRQGSLAP
jgi:hypothetical protein